MLYTIFLLLFALHVTVICTDSNSPIGYKWIPKNIVITGGAGFVGSHLVDNLMIEGHNVTVIDNLTTGNLLNLAHWLENDNLTVLREDVANTDWMKKVHRPHHIFHLASPASPKHYLPKPIETILANTLGFKNVLDKAVESGARVVLASTSEVYGSPLVHPQAENYWGNVNPIGPRSCYDESKRLAEAMAMAYKNQRNVSIGIARIFNTYGPRMMIGDGRVVSNFVSQALTNKSISIYGDGTQTRSFQYVSDLIGGLRKLMDSSHTGPLNFGNPDERSINELAKEIKNILNQTSTSDVTYQEIPIDDPPRRCPDVELAKKLLNWTPMINLRHGLNRTIDYMRAEINVVNRNQVMKS